MTALSAERNTRRRQGDSQVEALAASVKVFAGSLVMRNAAGHLTKGITATGATGVGRAGCTADNSAGAAGALTLEYRRGIFLFANSAGGDLITIADLGKLCYIVDDQTVAKSDGTGTRSRAGIVDGIESNGVWVRMDEALTRAA